MKHVNTYVKILPMIKNISNTLYFCVYMFIFMRILLMKLNCLDMFCLNCTAEI